MDSPDRMSWTPSSSVKKRKRDEFIETCIHIRIPGAYPESPGEGINYLHGSQYMISPTPPARINHPRLSPDAQARGAMFNNENVPASLRRLFQIAASVGSTLQAISSSAVDTLAGPSGRAAQFFQNNCGSLYTAVEAIGNTAKRLKLTVRRQPVDQPATASSAQPPSTPPQRISRFVNRTPTPAFRTQSSILRQTRDTGFRKVKKTLRWVEDQQIINDASNDMIRHQTGQLSSASDDQINEQPILNIHFSRDSIPYEEPMLDEFEIPEPYLSPIQDRPEARSFIPTSPVPLMSGALPCPADQALDLTISSVDDQDALPYRADEGTDLTNSFIDNPETFSENSICSSSLPHTDDPSEISSLRSSQYVDSVTSSLLVGLDEEDLLGIETREEKKARKKQEAKEAKARKRQADMEAYAEMTGRAKALPSGHFSRQLRALCSTDQIPKPPKKSVAFYNSPGTSFPITLIKEYNSEDALTPPIQPYNRVPISGLPATPSLRRLKSVAVSPPVTPENVASSLSSLGVSSRRSSSRLDQIAAEEQVKRDQAAALEAKEAERKAQEEAARRAAEEAREAEERIRLGIRRMPRRAVIEPLTASWEDQVARAMQTGSLQREVARTSTGEIIKRRDFGYVLPQDGIDDPAGWLNDTMITAYLQAVVDYGQTMRGVRRGTLPKIHAFSTFFYTNLTTKGYESVRRWATRAKFGGKDLLDMEKIFIPINKGGNHWVLAHINPQTKTIEYFDSFHGSARSVFDNIKVWLKAELRDAFVDSEWTLSQNGGPTQSNGSDCGVFCATTAKMIVLGVDPKAFSADDIPTQRRRMLAEIMNGGFSGDFVPSVEF